MVNESLMAPFDVGRFTLAYLAIALVPGYAMAALARPRSDWIEYIFAFGDNGPPMGG